MKQNLLIKILSSIPIILIILYFIPFLGVCLILLRYFVYNRKRILTPITLLIVGILILIPNIIKVIFDIANIEIASIPYLSDIIGSELYNVEFIKFGKQLISIGVIFLILSFIFRSLFNKVSSKINNGIRNYINETERKNYEISKKNDMEMRIKQEKSKNTSYVKCSYCGSDNVLSEKTGTCKFCRRSIENKNYKS